MDVIPDRTRYTVGDTATVLFASPFTDAEAWITVEREGLLQQRRLRITERHHHAQAPDHRGVRAQRFVSIVVARGRSAAARPAGRSRPADHPRGLRRAPRHARSGSGSTVDGGARLAREYRPGDTARVALQVRDAGGTGRRSEVTLWAVDEGVLALTGYKHARSDRPALPAARAGHAARQQPHDRGAAGARRARRASARPAAAAAATPPTCCAPGSRPPRSSSARWSPTPRARRRRAARLPDNLTTFRVMAVAVTAGDRYGSGQSPAARDPAARGAPRAAAVPARRRPVRGRRRGEQPRRRRRRRQGRRLGARRGARGARDPHRDARAGPGAGGPLRFPRPRRPTAPGSASTPPSGADADAVRARASAQARVPPAVVHGGRRAPRHGVRGAPAAGGHRSRSARRFG